MNFISGIILSFITVLVLVFIPFVGMQVANLQVLFGVIIPYAAMVLFLVGVVGRLLLWSFSAVPFRIPTTAGQQKSFPWIKPSKIENPSSAAGVFGRMLLEILLFRSLFRNSTMEYREGPRVTYEWEKWLWLVSHPLSLFLCRGFNPTPPVFYPAGSGFCHHPGIPGCLYAGRDRPLARSDASRYVPQRDRSVGCRRLFILKKGLYPHGPLYFLAYRLFPLVFNHRHCHHRDPDALSAESRCGQRQGIGSWGW